MGVDLRAIIKHNLSPKQIIEIPSIIDTWTDIRKLKKPHMRNPSHYGEWFNAQLNSNCTWYEDSIPTEEKLEIIWEYYESEARGACKVPPFQNYLNTFWGDIRFFRKVALICHSPEHKFANLYYPEIAQNIIEVNREIARKFNSDKIVYCVDSGSPTEAVYHEASRGQSLDEHIENMNKQFFIPPKDLKVAMKGYYFIDDFSGETNHFEEW